MKFTRDTFRKIFWISLLAVTVAKADGVKTATGLIKQAHKHDNMYTLGPEANQQMALSFYQSALIAEPDEKQRLHILYRMAQLYGSAYDLTKGEKPDFRRAIELNKQIIDSYPPDELQVFKAMMSIGDHHVTLWEFGTALKWFRKILEFDTTQISGPEGAAAKIRRYQQIAVGKVAYALIRIHPYFHDPVLQGIADKYPGSFIAEKAQQLIDENPHKFKLELETLLDFGEETTPSNPTLQANTSTPVALSRSHKGIKMQSDIIPEITGGPCSVEPNTVEKSQKDKHVAKEPRAPPLNYLSECIIGAAGLTILGFAVIIIRKKITSS